MSDPIVQVWYVSLPNGDTVLTDGAKLMDPLTLSTLTIPDGFRIPSLTESLDALCAATLALPKPPVASPAMIGMNDHYEAIYSQDSPRGEAHGWIQWKGTNVCIDLHCVCGYHDHVDAEFFYSFECPKCGKRYAVGQVVKLIPLTKEQEADYEGFMTPFTNGGPVTEQRDP